MKLAEIRLMGGQFARETEQPERARIPLSRRIQFGISPVRRNSSALRSEHGGGTIKAILWTILLIYGAFVAYKILPAYVAEYQLADKCRSRRDSRW